MKLRIKITLCMLGLLSILFGIGGSLLISTSFHASLEREKETAYNSYQMVLGTLQIIDGVTGGLDYYDISHTLEQLSEQNTGAWSSLRLYTSDESIYEYGSGEIAKPTEAASPGSCTIRYTEDRRSRHTLILSGAMTAETQTLYVDMARDITPLFDMRQTQQQTYQLVFLLMAALCALLSYSISRLLTRPLVSLSNASRAISTGKLSSRARTTSKDEIGLVARDFNAMAEILEDTISRLTDSMERQDRFIGSFAHEMKTPMTSIIGYADLIRGQTLTPEEQAEAANYIVAEGKRLENLSQKLLDILVLEKSDSAFIRTSPSALIHGLANHLSPLFAQQGVSLSLECEEGVCLLEPDLVKSLLINLWDNARKSMNGRGGSIAVHSEMLPDGCRISIRDTGCGIPPEALEHLTEAFYRVDKSRAREQGGVGLGLALCHEIVQIHNGTLRFESEVGEGTTVSAELKGGAA